VTLDLNGFQISGEPERNGIEISDTSHARLSATGQ